MITLLHIYTELEFVKAHSVHRSQDSSVSIVTGYRLDSWGSIPDKGKIFLFSIGSRPALGLTQHPIQWVLWVKQPGCKADHSPPSGAEIKNGGAVLPLIHVSSWHIA
jgi:hypothetical protein